MTILEATALAALIVYLIGLFAGWREARAQQAQERRAGHLQAFAQLEIHFSPVVLSELNIAERQFPYRVRADLHQAIDQLFATGTTVLNFCGVRKQYPQMGIRLSDCLVPSRHDPAMTCAVEYEEIDIGEPQPVRCMKTGLWTLERDGQRFAVLLSPVADHCGVTGVKFEVAYPMTPDGLQLVTAFFQHLEESVLKARSYRGKILSLEQSKHSYSGAATGITVHKLRHVERDEVILPSKTLDLLDRNVIEFAKQRERLRELSLATKKGLLFHGPPGTGKTHTIHYLTRALPGHSTLLITAEQVGLLAEYMTLARLLQPSIVVIEDVDLIARDRSQMQSACEEALLNKLLNEMDGLRESADILFILTTNRPEMLEAALAARPGRIDQAIEFPLPDDDGRRKLIKLYSGGLTLSSDLIEQIIRRTDKVSAAFLKELMRRCVQTNLHRGGNGTASNEDVDEALQEMLVHGGILNLKLLGANTSGN